MVQEKRSISAIEKLYDSFPIFKIYENAHTRSCVKLQYHMHAYPLINLYKTTITHLKQKCERVENVCSTSVKVVYTQYIKASKIHGLSREIL